MTNLSTAVPTESKLTIGLDAISKYSAVLLGFVYVCGFLKYISYFKALGITLSELPIVNAELLFKGCSVLALSLFSPLVSALIVSLLGWKSDVCKLLTLGIIGFTVLLSSGLFLLAGLTGFDVVYCTFFIVFLTGWTIGILFLKSNPEHRIVLRLCTTVAVLFMLELAILLGQAEAKRVNPAEILKVQLLAAPDAVPQLEQVGIVFASGKQLSNSVELIYTTNRDYFVRLDGGKVVQLSRERVWGTTRTRN
jgi:hypothetical protein